MMKLLRAADHRLTRWKNGLGETREVAAATDPNDPAGFLWRVSMATVAADGPFSHFPGIDRTIAVMQGDGMRLTVDGADVMLSHGGKPFSFAGEATVTSFLTGGTTIDLNAMSLRSGLTHRMTRLDMASGATVTAKADVSVLVFNSAANVSFAGQSAQVERFDAIAGIASGGQITIDGGPALDAFLIEFDQLR